ncbi:hypothetical protein GV794_23545 [Nocardia cyriacigeorgica]|uniref:Uncharacterized protein n=1 Tax=Nocardia cyriacigeorgica TaxID=135487 RepID=A0ABX0CQ55_9NOCA|nr:hypothetical protein [Nocardia cyriacigeorgica]NEW58595.1 hypothetical protein [Nocardia cyriacigeorgica]
MSIHDNYSADQIVVLFEVGDRAGDALDEIARHGFGGTALPGLMDQLAQAFCACQRHGVPVAGGHEWIRLIHGPTANRTLIKGMIASGWAAPTN